MRPCPVRLARPATPAAPAFAPPQLQPGLCLAALGYGDRSSCSAGLCHCTEPGIRRRKEFFATHAAPLPRKRSAREEGRYACVRFPGGAQASNAQPSSWAHLCPAGGGECGRGGRARWPARQTATSAGPLSVPACHPACHHWAGVPAGSQGLGGRSRCRGDGRAANGAAAVGSAGADEPLQALATAVRRLRGAGPAGPAPARAGYGPWRFQAAPQS